ncbi:MAG: SRPBCC family protein [Betaproteobacteria bacterium]
MASIRKEIMINAPADKVWAAIRDVGNTHKLFAGVVTQTRLEEGARVVTFANGMEVRELIIDLDDVAKRFAYSAVGGRATHHNAALQVDADGDASKVTWTLDFLPNEILAGIQPLVEMGSAAMKKSLEQG